LEVPLVPLVWVGSWFAEEPETGFWDSGLAPPEPVAASVTHCQASELWVVTWEEFEADVAELAALSAELVPVAAVVLAC
jgi:hypothetical protein